jgi:hypothetical protein
MGLWRTLIAWYLRSKIAQIFSVILAGFVAILTYGAKQREKGKAETLEEMHHEDNSRARQIRTAVDAARNSNGVLGEDDRGYRD